MIKKEIIWREILFQTIEFEKIEFTQKELASKYGFSLSTVFNALKNLRSSGIIEAHGRGFKILDIEKFLYFWATQRNVKKEIIYQTHAAKSVRAIEGEMPPDIIFGAFTAFCKKYQETPADYDKVYVYTKEDNLNEIKSRFPYEKGYANVIVLKADPHLESYGKITCDPQTFVDLWNLPDWYAKDFLLALKNKIL